MNRKFVWILLLGSSVLFTQCKDSANEVEPDDENELITSITLKFTEAGTTNVTTFKSTDKDGDGGNPPITESISLKPNTTYQMAIELLDESKTPTVDITKEVEEKSYEHLFIYTPAPTSLLTYAASDKDKNNLPIGLNGKVVTGAAATGKLKVQLRHQPGSKNGTATPGSDDVNVDFPLTIQ